MISISEWYFDLIYYMNIEDYFAICNSTLIPTSPGIHVGID